MTLKELVQKKLTVSELMNGREKLETRDVKYKELTLVDFDIVSDANGKPYCVYVVAEYPDNFIFSGTVLTDMCIGIAEAFPDTYREELKKEPIKFKLTDRRSKNNMTYTMVELV